MKIPRKLVTLTPAAQWEDPMFSFLKALVGGAGYASNPVGMGVMHLRQVVKKYGLDSSNYTDAFLSELSQYAHTYSQQMFMLSKKDQPVTYFVQHLEYIGLMLAKAADGEVPDLPEPLHLIFSKHGISSSTS